MVSLDTEVELLVLLHLYIVVHDLGKLGFILANAGQFAILPQPLSDWVARIEERFRGSNDTNRGVQGLTPLHLGLVDGDEDAHELLLPGETLDKSLFDLVISLSLMRHRRILNEIERKFDNPQTALHTTIYLAKFRDRIGLNEYPELRRKIENRLEKISCLDLVVSRDLLQTPDLQLLVLLRFGGNHDPDAFLVSQLRSTASAVSGFLRKEGTHHRLGVLPERLENELIKEPFSVPSFPTAK